MPYFVFVAYGYPSSSAELLVMFQHC